MTYLFTASRTVTVDTGETFKQTASIYLPGAPAVTEQGQRVRFLRWAGILGQLDGNSWTHSDYVLETLSEQDDDDSTNTGNMADVELSFKRYDGTLNPKLIQFKVNNVSLDNALSHIVTKFSEVCFSGYQGSGVAPKSIVITLHN